MEDRLGGVWTPGRKWQASRRPEPCPDTTQAASNLCDGPGLKGGQRAAVGGLPRRKLLLALSDERGQPLPQLRRCST